ncbi:MAG: FkbM family methyltransferase [Pyrinomonadaceae bacterium]|nr:FkbM family methyltransferase [Pyrinomonadaceae bacterium]
MKQLVKRLILPGGRRLRRLRGGIAGGMLMELDLAHQSQRYFGLDERELLRPLRRLIAECASLIDVGANDGYYTMAFLRSKDKCVVACEPGPAMERLLANARANGYETGERFRAERRLVGLDKEGISIAELVKDLPHPVLLKVDIDGGEFELLQSAERCDRLHELRWLIETHSPELEKQCVAWLQSHGYRTEIIYNARWRVLLPEERPIEHNRWLLAEHEQL